MPDRGALLVRDAAAQQRRAELEGRRRARGGHRVQPVRPPPNLRGLGPTTGGGVLAADDEVVAVLDPEAKWVVRLPKAALSCLYSPLLDAELTNGWVW